MIALWLCAGGVRTAESRPTIVRADELIAPVATWREALSLTEQERTVLDDIRDGDATVDEPGFYVAMRHAAMMPTTGSAGAPYKQLAQMLADPEGHRLAPVWLPVRVWRVDRWYPANVTRTPWWGKRSVWRVDATLIESGEPVVIFLAEQPSNLAEGAHPRGPRRYSEGLFYKLVTWPVDSPGPGRPMERRYPVFAARSLLVSTRDMGAAAWPYVAVAVMVLLLAAVRLLGRRRPGTSVRGGGARDVASSPEDAVDPWLVEEVRRYETGKERESQP